MKLEIEKIIDNEDGTKSIVFDYDDEMLQMVKLRLGKEDLTEEEITNFFLLAIKIDLEQRKNSQSE